MRRRHALIYTLVAVIGFAHATPALAYLKLGISLNGRQQTLRWRAPTVRYHVTERGAPGVNPMEFQAAVARAFATWQAVPTASIAYEFGGYTEALPLSDDGSTTLGFRERPDLDRVLASTSFLVDTATGELIESDIFFNAAFPWSTAAAGEAGKYDLESIAVHEIGHLSGLGHSALGETELRAGGGRRVLAAESVMFPIAFSAGDVSDRALRADDIAGISDLYPAGGFNQTTGSISGRVAKHGDGVFGAHVVAFDPASGRLVGNFTLNARGQFSIAGLLPGPHLIRVEPLDDADVDGFFTPTSSVDLDFPVTFFSKLVVVPRGGDSGTVEIAVVPK